MSDLTPDAIELYTVLALGVAGVCLGLPGLFVRRHGENPRAAVRQALGLSVLLGLVGAAALLAGLPSFVWQPTLALASIWSVFAVLRTGVVGSITQFVTRLIAQPRIQAAAVVLAGGCLLVWETHYLTTSVENAMTETEALLAVITSAPPLEENPEVAVYTDAGQRVPLWRALLSHTPDDLGVEPEYLRLHGYDDKLIRTAPPDISHNCHGWVFTGGKGWIRGMHVEQILRDNQYQVISRPNPGDVAIYRDGTGSITHTALVRAVSDDRSILLESKWGKLGRFIHTASEHVYANASCTYYRSPRGTHVLRINGDL